MYSANLADVSWKKLNDEAVLIHLETNFYYSLNRTGTWVWEKLAAAGNSGEDAESLAAALAKTFDHPVDDVRRDVKNILKVLVREKLILGEGKWPAQEKRGTARNAKKSAKPRRAPKKASPPTNRRKSRSSTS